MADRVLEDSNYSLQNVGREVVYVSEQDTTPADVNAIGYHILPPTTVHKSFSFLMQVSGNEFYIWSPKGRSGLVSLTEAP